MRILSAANSYLDYIGHREYQLAGQLKDEKPTQPELSRAEYLHLLRTAKALDREKVYLLVKLFAATGLFAQELPEVTVAALLELGSGFDGDLTMRENAYLRGAMLGYTREFMDSTYEQIISFAELEEFQDRPFKQISSGMKSRLAFSIASLVKPDILILDEVLAVGDGAFQKKSEAKMREIIESGAATILVSHPIDQVRSMCNKILWLHKGQQIVFSDDVHGACNSYTAFLAGDQFQLERYKTKSEDILPHGGAPAKSSAAQAQIQTAQTSEGGHCFSRDCKEVKGEKCMFRQSADITIQNIYRKIKPTDKLAFFSSFLMAFFTHLYLFSHKNMNEDMLGYVTYTKDHLNIGRWSEFLFKSILPDYMMPMVLGIIAFISLGITSVITLKILRILKPVHVVVCSSLIVTFPVLAYSFGYLFMVPTYCAALVLAALSVYLTFKFKFGFLVGGICLGLSMGCYQSYLGYAATLCVMSLVLQLFRESLSAKSFVIRILRGLLLGVSGAVCYFGGLKLRLHINNTELSDYKGASSMGQYPLEEIPGLFHKSYTRFFEFFTGKSFFKTSQILSVVYFLILIALAFLFLKECWQRGKAQKSAGSLLLVFILVLTLPLTINIVDLLAAETSSSTLAIYQMVLLFIFPFAFLELDSGQENSGFLKFKSGCSWLIIGCALVLSVSYFFVSNIYSLKLSIYTERTISLDNRILARLEQLPEFNSQLPVAVIGDQHRLYGQTDDFPDIQGDQGLWDQFIGFSGGANSTSNSSKFANIVQGFMGVPIQSANSTQISRVLESDEYKQMGVWPDQNSIAIIDGIAVVNCALPVAVETQINKEDQMITWKVTGNSENLDGCTYAWYIYYNDERVDTYWYDTENQEITYYFSEPGEYCARVFIKDADETWKINKYSEDIEIP